MTLPWLLPAITATAQIASVVAVLVIAGWLVHAALYERWLEYRIQRRHLKKLRQRAHPSGAATTQNVTLIPRPFDWERMA